MFATVTTDKRVVLTKNFKAIKPCIMFMVKFHRETKRLSVVLPVNVEKNPFLKRD